MIYAPYFILGKLFIEKTLINLFNGWSVTKTFHPYILFLLFYLLFHLYLLLLKKLLAILMRPLKVLTKLHEIGLFFFISCFTVSVTPSINRHEFSNDFMNLIISFMSSFKINKINSFPALTAPISVFFFKFIYCV